MTRAAEDLPVPAGAPAPTPGRASSRWLGLLPFIGVILFVVTAVPVLVSRDDDWQRTLLVNAVVYMIGWAGIGAGISHLFFSGAISRSIGFDRSPFELEVGFAGLAFGVTGVLAGSHGTEYWLAIIIASSVYRVGCGLGHVRSIVRSRNYAVNNTAILVIDFLLPAFLVVAYVAWS
ncbi:hypothetical protein Sked_21130 [Sanguibacter keddieii DSM 10542]|uniref:DUF4345 domain-containing protein n=1 Tax=Sanguibacter keddieii (strain ATCC 51767 / DSM 10542 / NCFB 3025 / ST-74) TaxID=446469 RepID=D1BHW3_SANKS|nr:DUF6790 family protein [Sanguibacter keddieii]ACZ22033.1 hypothetical protein Sked_21130 [Sanguibacter keddieii DSM 10542]